MDEDAAGGGGKGGNGDNGSVQDLTADSDNKKETVTDKTTKKAIYGNATEDERNELAEEGIDLISVPWIEKDN